MYPIIRIIELLCGSGSAEADTPADGWTHADLSRVHPSGPQVLYYSSSTPIRYSIFHQVHPLGPQVLNYSSSTPIRTPDTQLFIEYTHQDPRYSIIHRVHPSGSHVLIYLSFIADFY